MSWPLPEPNSWVVNKALMARLLVIEIRTRVSSWQRVGSTHQPPSRPVGGAVHGDASLSSTPDVSTRIHPAVDERNAFGPPPAASSSAPVAASQPVPEIVARNVARPVMAAAGVNPDSALVETAGSQRSLIFSPKVAGLPVLRLAAGAGAAPP